MKGESGLIYRLRFPGSIFLKVAIALLLGKEMGKETGFLKVSTSHRVSEVR
ncbi:MAG: hypothetical protein P5683_20940 [Limnospira sp. PMC 1279.21]|uniref:hypothetical protein n=1 Tax=unclassified Limnospira TaxID=2642885 RepID=UPI0028E0A66B|nr:MULTISPECIES: hypothetical protein [unclassified Limnospira]MDT9205602.1 hypothetical protein [Limnospira sp. PMC 1243.20]MDT9205603.1 hypothetical protein [Limnospira sp. PMC 1243.20]MDT9221058.1 hypothetical protein [Limnospira sp. PMC 1240.20]MDT9226095.1 hypothetical protein [Limnospira sp. PMC 1279.21]MDT9266869.1 hypothetical protein [Limnospira sp. PMC 1223.20]